MGGRRFGYHDRNAGLDAAAMKERQARELALSRAEKIYTAEEFAELLADMSSNRVEVRVYDDGICLSRTYS
jgi:hypothetical protein